MSALINIGFVPLTDAAPLIVAQEMGFAREEGITLNLSREPNWSTLRDKLGFGILDGAHILLPLANALDLGVGAVQCDIDISMILNMNGNAFVANHQLSKDLFDLGSKIDDARSFGEAIIALAQNGLIRVAVPYLDSMHVTMLRHLVTRLGKHPNTVFDFHVSAPSSIETKLKSGEVDGFMVGAPWATRAVENDSGVLMLTSNKIWQGAPEKILGLRHEWVKANDEAAIRLTRAVYRSANWVSEKSNASVASEILSRPVYLDMDASTIERSLRGEVLLNANGSVVRDPLALQLDARRTGFPWQSSVRWVALQNAPFWGVSTEEVDTLAYKQCRTDIYRKALESISGPLPSANAKLEGSLDSPVSVIGRNNLMLGPDAFFDGEIYEPA